MGRYMGYIGMYKVAYDIYTFKCTGQSSSTCITARGDNDEGLSSITIRSTFDKVSKRMSWYEYVYLGAVHKSFQ